MTTEQIHDKLAKLREIIDLEGHGEMREQALTLLDEIAAEIPVWRDISSAPKERGKSILVYCYDDKCVYTACWWNEEWTHFHGSEPIIGLITRWMPIPTPPAKKGDV